MSDEYTRCTVQNERGVFERDVIESRIWVVVFINSSKWGRRQAPQTAICGRAVSFLLAHLPPGPRLVRSVLRVHGWPEVAETLSISHTTMHL